MSAIRIDRRKHDVDISEHVLEGGVRMQVGDGDGAHVVGGVALAVWPLGLVTSTVRVQMFGERDVNRPPGRRRPGDDPTR